MEVGEMGDAEPLELSRQARERAGKRLETHPAGLEVSPGDACS